MATEFKAREKVLEAGGLRLRYFDAGDGDPIVLLASKKDDTSVEPILAEFAMTHPVISLDEASDDSAYSKQVCEQLPGALTGLGIGQYNVLGVSAGASPALALAISAPERVAKLILLSPLQTAKSSQMPELTAVKASTLVLVGTRDTSGAIEAGRLCREGIASCHLSFVYDAGHALIHDRPQACLDAIIQFLREGEQFIISNESQLIRP
jgi:pimeloyl-ACP methyl ester carboxylesterase